MKKQALELTSYDLLKVFAVILMVIDHTGQYFYPDEMWFRVFGRLCVPIWFFLIGYADTAKVTPALWIGGGIVALTALAAGLSLFPLNILISIIIARSIRDHLMRGALENPESLRGLFLILVFASIPTGVVFEYGSLGFLFVIMGGMMRHWDQAVIRIKPVYLFLYIGASFLVFCVAQGIAMPRIDAAKALVLFAGLAGVMVILIQFRAVNFSYITKALPKPVSYIVKIMGRRTLEIYIVHLVIFRVMAMMHYPEKYRFFEWIWVPGNLVNPIL